MLIGRVDYVEENTQVVQSWLNLHHKTVNWINENPEKTTIAFNQFMKKTFGKSLPDEIVSESLDNLQITSDPIHDSIFVFAERADSLGYLGRDGYDLNGIFYEVDITND